MFCYYVRLQQINKKSVFSLRGTNHKFVSNNDPKGELMKFVDAILKFMCDIGQASYAAHLARNQQWERAQALYKKQ